MNKLVGAMVGSLVLSAGLVAAGGTAAHADPYPGTVATTTEAFVAPEKVSNGASANVCGKVTVTTGSGTPSGELKIKVTRKGGGFKQSATLDYAGGKVCLRTKRLNKPGKYTATVDFNATANSVYKDSSDSISFKVKK